MELAEMPMNLISGTCALLLTNFLFIQIEGIKV